MDRRSFVVGAGAVALSSNLRAAQTNMGAVQRAYVAHPTIVKQDCPLWCWAASTSMIFAAHGHPVRQENIVTRLFGGLVCQTSGDTINIVNLLNSLWIDDNGVSFQPHVVAAYDAWHGVNMISNNFIIRELINDSPLLYCNTHHAMVVVNFDYITGPMGPIPQMVGVLDPFPGVPDYHPLSPPELFGATMAPGGQMTFLAAVHVS